MLNLICDFYFIVFIDREVGELVLNVNVIGVIEMVVTYVCEALVDYIFLT